MDSPVDIKILTVIIPVFNEEKTITKVLDMVCSVTLQHQIKKQILIVNDGSTDLSKSVIEEYIHSHPENSIELINSDKNHGKGASIRLGIEKTQGEFLIIQDADLEYDPNEYNLLLKPVLDGHADIVFGSRFRGSNPHRILFFWHTIGNRFLTFLSNMFNNLNLTDMETCYKLMKTSLVKPIRLKENRFGFEPEITTKIARIKDVRIYEVGISYYGRGFKDGKKINWKDGFRAIWCILKYNLLA
jgi:glycosyltransferase involved in cell wall biosynthesis